MNDAGIEVAIVGGGSAGLTAALYAARAGRRVVVFERGVVGGQIASTGIVENYPGFPDGTNGLDLALAMQRQAERFGAEVRAETVTALRRDGVAFVLTVDGELPREVHACAVIVTAGTEPLRLGVPGERELTGAGFRPARRAMRRCSVACPSSWSAVAMPPWTRGCSRLGSP